MTVNRSKRSTLFQGGLGFAVLVVVLLMPTGSATAISGWTSVAITHGKIVVGSGRAHFCPGQSLTGPLTGVLCSYGSVANTTGTVKIYSEIQGNVTATGISGPHNFSADGTLNLTWGFARASANCTSNGANGYAQTYVFWHLWIWDQNRSSWVSQSNSGYIWDSGSVYCPSIGGRAHLASRAISGPFNSSAFGSTGSTTYSFIGTHVYTFTFFLGCTILDHLGGTYPSAQFEGHCNWARAPSSSTLTLGSVEIS